MFFKRARTIEILSMLMEILLLNLGYILSYYLRMGNLRLDEFNEYLLLQFFLNTNWVILRYLIKDNKDHFFSGWEILARNTFFRFLIHVLITAFLLGFIKKAYYSRLLLSYFYLSFLCALFLKQLFIQVLYKEFQKKFISFRRIYFIGKGETSKEMGLFLQSRPEFGYRVLGYFTQDVSIQQTKESVLEEIKAQIIQLKLDEIYISLPDIKSDLDLDELIEFAENNMVRVRILPDLRKLGHKNLKVHSLEGLPIFSFRNLPLDEPVQRMVKRTFDIFFSLAVIILLLSWLYPLLAILIKISSPGAVLFKQKRTGKNNEEFWCLKFRSMRVNADSDTKQAQKGDARITPIGKFLRKTNLDEFPQFINVFLGNMSVVGPRPHMLKHTEEYSQIIQKYMVRHFVKPGVTGLAQVKGFRGETTDPNMMKGRIKVDIFYIENWSFWLDIKIILLTLWNGVKGDEKAF